METKRFFTVLFAFQFFAAFSAYAQLTAHGEFSLDVISANNEVKTLTAGYDSRATNGIDSSLGEIPLPPYTQNQFDARFRLPDSITTTYKDFRAGCNYFAAANYILELGNSQSVTISSIHLSDVVTSVKFINVTNETVLAEFWSPDSIYFQTTTPLKQIKISVLYELALSRPRSNFYSPQGGEVLQAGSVVDIKFSFSFGAPVQNDLFLSTDNGASWEYFATTPNRSDTSYSWTVPFINSNKCKIRVGDYPCYYTENLGTFVVTTAQYTPMDGFELPMQFSSGNKTIGLIAGIHPDATDGLDTMLGEIPLTQAAKPDSFDARFLVVDKITSLKDLKKGGSLYYGPKRYKILLQKKANDTCTLRFSLRSGVQAQLEYYYYIPSKSLQRDTIFNAGNVEFNLTENLSINELYLSLFFDGTVPVEVNLTAEKSFNLSQNYPNPFNPVTTINYSVPELGLVNITVFDVLGREVKTLVNSAQNAGEYSVPFDASKLSGGIYYYRITTSENSMTRKMILLK